MCPSIEAQGFRPIVRHAGFLPIEDYGLVGDGMTAALVGRDGSVDWLCVPQFDSPPVFARILDRGAGSFRIAPGGAVEARHAYLTDTNVLVTELAGPGGTVRIDDALALRAGAKLEEDASASVGELVRRVRARGRARIVVELEVCGGAEVEHRAAGLHLHPLSPDLRTVDLQLWSSRRIDQLPAVIDLEDGEIVDFVLRWGGAAHRHLPIDLDELWTNTIEAWRRWASLVTYDGPCRDTVRRCALGLKMLDHFEHGPIIAAPTTSLPERIGGARNWDYRFAWVRDAALSFYALRRIGLDREATGFVGWVLDAVERGPQPLVLYDLDGLAPPREREQVHLEGYRFSRPVRFGNNAAWQLQNDVYGEIIDCAFQGAREYPLDPEIWARLQRIADAAGARWDRPDRGIWEIRSTEQHFTYSAALCHVALDRMARLAEQFQLPGDIRRWRSTAETIVATILERAWDPVQRALCGTLDRTVLDASVLALPLRRVIPATHPRMIATVEAIERHLGAGAGLLYRYRPDELPDGVGGEEGAFLLCSFWLVETLALQGRLDRANALFEALCARAGPLGLLPEQIDPAAGAFAGNYPQAVSHVGLIASGVTLHRLARHQRWIPTSTIAANPPTST